MARVIEIKTEVNMKRKTCVWLAAAVLLTMILVLGATMVTVHAQEDIQVIEEGEGEAVAFWDRYTPEQWEQFLKEKVVPYAAAAISALGLLYAMVSPVLKKLSNSSKNFDVSAEATKKTTDLAETVTTICGSLQSDNEKKYQSMERAIAQTMNTMQERESEMMAGVQRMVAQAVKQVQDAEEQMREQYDQINDEIRLIYEREGNIMQIGKIGFGEQTELIKKGVADSIMKIGGEADNERAQA
jgi:hypothetical protein